MSLRRTRPDRSFGVNIVPLVDVLIVLIFFFLITMQFRDHQRVEITPPKMEAQAGQSSDIP